MAFNPKCSFRSFVVFCNPCMIVLWYCLTTNYDYFIIHSQSVIYCITYRIQKPPLNKLVKKKNHYLVASITTFFEDGRSWYYEVNCLFASITLWWINCKDMMYILCCFSKFMHPLAARPWLCVYNMPSFFSFNNYKIYIVYYNYFWQSVYLYIQIFLCFVYLCLHACRLIIDKIQ